MYDAKDFKLFLCNEIMFNRVDKNRCKLNKNWVQKMVSFISCNENTFVIFIDIL